MPRVFNKSKNVNIPEGAIYVGRPSKWGNPFKIGRDGTRDECIVKYVNWLEGMLFNKRLNIDELAGKDLVCWCAPSACHADVLLEIAAK